MRILIEALSTPARNLVALAVAVHSSSGVDARPGRGAGARHNVPVVLGVEQTRALLQTMA